MIYNLQRFLLIRKMTFLAHQDKEWSGDYWFGDKTKPEFSILVMGDSIAASLGIPKLDETIGARIAKQYESTHHVHLVNHAHVGIWSASLSKEEITSKWDIIVAIIGSNDLLHGISPDLAKKSLNRLVRRLKQHSNVIVIAGPSEVSAIDYLPFWFRFPLKFRQKDYSLMMEKVAKEHDVNYANLLLKPFKKTWFIKDHTHPNGLGDKEFASVISEQISLSMKKVHTSTVDPKRKTRLDNFYNELLFWTHTAIVIFMLFMGLFLSLWWIAVILILQKIHLYLFDGCAITRWEQAIGGMPQDMTYFQLAFKRFFHKHLSHDGAHTVYLFVTTITILVAAIGTLLR